MALDSRLTVLLTLKDRHLFTGRWMDYANQVKLPFKVLIADGSADEGAATLLANRARFPQVEYEYHRFPIDQTYADFYAKVVNALSLVDSPFVVMADNDDLFVVEALKRAVDFLASHADYAACGGHIGVFWIDAGDPSSSQSGVYGRHVEYRGGCPAPSLLEASAAGRVQHYSLSYDAEVYYGVQRTSELKDRYQALRVANLTDFYLAEYVTNFLLVASGRVEVLQQLYLARQRNTPQTASLTHQRRFGDFFDRILGEAWSHEFSKFVGIVATEISARDGLSIDEARAVMRRSFRTAFAPDIIQCLVDEPSVPVLGPLTSLAIRHWLRFAPTSLVRRSIRSLFRSASWLSLGTSQLLTRPVANLETDFKPIVEALTSPPRPVPDP